MYTFFDQDREYVAYEEIPPHLLMAFLSAEDRQYWDHDGVDKWWILRAIINNVQRFVLKDDRKLQWASTISQQLIKNTYLTSERNLKRKLQELVITRKVYKLLRENYRDEFPNYDEEKIELLVKKKILELYTNIIYLGNNSYGVGTASKHYFNKNPDELNLLESAILWGLPQAPSLYNPLSNKTEMMGDRQVTDGTNTYFLEEEGENSTQFLQQIQNEIESKIANTDLSKGDPDRIDKLRKWSFQNNDLIYTYTYSPGRKDYVLWAMYQEWYINDAELIEAFSQWVDYEFSSASYKINAPHFVFFVRDFLLNSPLFSELDLSLNDLLQWWYTIRTTLDMQKQKAAELASTETYQDLLYQWWESRSLLHIDSKRGEILAYLGSADYFNNEIQWQYDLIHAQRQQWSTLKPFIFAKLLENYPMWIDGKISDNYLDPWNGTIPRNADGGYSGIKTISWVLNNSRNLPAIRAFTANGWETIMKRFFKEIGLQSIIDERYYGRTLALWSAEESIYNLAQAYLQLSSPTDIVPTINPILSITGPYGEDVYKNMVVKTTRKIPKGNAYQIWNILKNRSEVSPYRRDKVSYQWLGEYAVKTWTSDIKKNDVVYAKDGYVVVYTPHDTLLSRAWNLDNTPLARNTLWSTITKPFVQAYIDNIGHDSFVKWDYDRPNDLLGGDIYKHTQYKVMPKEIQNLLWK